MFPEKWTRLFSVLLLLCTTLVLPGATNKGSSSTCALFCEITPGETDTKCTLPADPLKLNCSHEDHLAILRNVTSLDLSNNKLTQVPYQMFPYSKRLTKLSLSRNNIKEIKPNTFTYLENLEILDLAFNSLLEWKMNPTSELQSLSNLHMTGNPNWLPSTKQLLQLENLKLVSGLTLTKYCENCWLVKLEANITIQCQKDSLEWKWGDEINYGNTLDFIKAGFCATCLNNELCYYEQYELPQKQATFKVVLDAFLSLYVTGSLALLVNIMVVLVISSSKSLRGDLAVLLVLNIALCDVFIGLACVLYAKFNYITTDVNYIHERMEGKRYYYYDVKDVLLLRRITGFILTCAVVSQVCSSFVMTLEKCINIVFAMRPNIRFGKKNIVMALVLSWSFSVIFAFLPMYEVGGMNYTKDWMVIPLPKDKDPTDIGFVVGTQIMLMIIQFTSLILYLPIFIVAKNSGANVGIKRDATIAKKIALLVFTNLIFFAVPVVLGVFQYKIWQKLYNKIDNNWQDHTLAQFQWIQFVVFAFPLSCVSINSVLNPFLYALRHHKIKQQLGTIICRCRTVLNGFFVVLGQNFRQIAPQEDGLEMQQGSSTTDA